MGIVSFVTAGTGCGSREEAEDAAQTTFLNAFRGLERGIVPEHEEAWLLAIARNVCLTRRDAVRRRAIEVPRDPHTLDELVGTSVETNEFEGLEEAFAALTEQQRRAVFLREWHGLSYREIAQTLALSQAAVETLLFRARRTLARHVRRPLGIGSFAPWLRSLVEGSAGKLALGAAAVAVTTTGTIAIVPTHHPVNARRVTRDTQVPRSSPTAQQTPQAKIGSPQRRAIAPVGATRSDAAGRCCTGRYCARSGPHPRRRRHTADRFGSAGPNADDRDDDNACTDATKPRADDRRRCDRDRRRSGHDRSRHGRPGNGERSRDGGERDSDRASDDAGCRERRDDAHRSASPAP